MPYEIKFDDVPAGYTITSARGGENVTVAFSEFTSSEDGDLFIQRLDGFPSQIIAMLPSEPAIRPSTVDHLLAIIRRDKTATVYVNEIPIIAEIQVKGRDVEAGQAVFEDDIADVRRVTFHEIEIPADAGIVFLFSNGWRKGLFYDLSPISRPEPKPREYDLGALCGQLYAYLAFQTLFKISESDWNALISQGWFPFISLKRATIREIVSYAKNGWSIDDLLDRVSDEVGSMVPSLLEKWKKSDVFKDHLEVLTQATERFLARDYISANSILYPRIEGIMRSHHLSQSPSSKPTQTNLVSSVIDSGSGGRHRFSFLMPHYFRRYLREVYFADFDPNSPEILSRHSVAHGVVPADRLTMKGAVVGFLVLDQLSFYVAEGK